MVRFVIKATEVGKVAGWKKRESPETWLTDGSCLVDIVISILQ